ncbi:RNA polymerase sigma factor SigJ [Spiractinospora alimapuensis]|uniref:RNA polymerase sigma factor SigJ n=1 Tax=Spiractinospora alimapuensis TaxID=2820884 RepID=UPI001F2EB179|nr:RNA polymerase sigma factor SigJ [Spiractinospora alimapuensis]
MNDLSSRFDALRPRLVGAAYALTGSLEEAEDAVQEAWLRLARVDPGQIIDLEAWLVTTVSRIALDYLRSARHRREEYVGPWLPEPYVDHDDPSTRIELHESLSLAVLTVLESLSPAERAVFVLHDVFGVAFDEVARMVGRTPAACRQLARRARSHVEANTPRFDVDVTEQRRVVDAFTDAVSGGSLQELLRLLDPDVVLRTDGGGRVRAALNPIRGAEKVGRFLVGVSAAISGAGRWRPVVVNGMPGLVNDGAEGKRNVAAFTVDNGRITEIGLVLSPEKLRRIT